MTSALPPYQREPDPPATTVSRSTRRAHTVTRRRFMEVALTAAAATAGAAIIRTELADPTPPPTLIKPSTHQGDVASNIAPRSNLGELLPNAVDGRVLVLIEMAGGNDGPSTLIPANNGLYYDLRPTIAIPPDEVLPFDDETGLHPNLARLHQRGLSLVEGVGATNASLSHFDMGQRWARADQTGDGDRTSGFLARLANTLDNQSPLVGLSVGGETPRFAQATASTMALDRAEALAFLRSDELDPGLAAYQRGLRSFTAEDTSQVGMVGSSWAQLLELGAVINRQTKRERDESNPMYNGGGGLGRQLALTADLISANVGVRVVHARMDGFDTHNGHRGRHDRLMAEFDAAVDGFLQQVALDGLADQVLVATTSEFGRRMTENEGRGLDHGVASTVMLAGPVTAGRYGLPSRLDNLSGGNLRTEVPFDSYLATIAQDWLGVEGASVVAGEPELLDIGI